MERAFVHFLSKNIQYCSAEQRKRRFQYRAVLSILRGEWCMYGTRIFKLLRSPRIDSKEPLPPGTWRKRQKNLSVFS
jgi:hypothetical protein